MTERYDQNAILAYVESEMTDDERQTFEQQLAADDALRQLVSDLIADREALASLPSEPAPDGLIDAAIGQLERQMLLGPSGTPTSAPGSTPKARQLPLPGSASPGVSTRRFGRWVGYGAVAAVLAISFTFIFQSLDGQSLFQQKHKVRDRLAMTEPEVDAWHMDADEADGDASAAGSFADASLMKNEAGEGAKVAASEVKKQVEAAEPVTLEDAKIVPPMLVLGDANQAGPSVEADAVDGDLDTALAWIKSSAEMRKEKRAAQLAKVDPEPEYRINVATAHTEATREQVKRWAISNRVEVVYEFPITTLAASVESKDKVGRQRGAARERVITNASPAMGLMLQETEAPPPVLEQIVVELEETQIDALVRHLDAPADQRANLVRNKMALNQPAAASPAPIVLPSMASEQVGEDVDTKKNEDNADKPAFSIDWHQVLQTQVPLAPIQRLGRADRSDLPTPARRVQVYIDVVAEPVAPVADEASADQP